MIWEKQSTARRLAGNKCHPYRWLGKNEPRGDVLFDGRRRRIMCLPRGSFRQYVSWTHHLKQPEINNVCDGTMAVRCFSHWHGSHFPGWRSTLEQQLMVFKMPPDQLSARKHTHTHTGIQHVSDQICLL